MPHNAPSWPDNVGHTLRNPIGEPAPAGERGRSSQLGFRLSPMFRVPKDFSPFAFACWSWDMRATKAKSHAQHANAHPINAWSCQICNQHRAPSPARGSGFKFDTTRTDHARTGITAVRPS
jgi:hypothetical protein